MKYFEYFDEAWSQRTPIDVLRENGYTANLYLDRGTTYGSMEQIFDRADNIAYGDKNLKPNINAVIDITGRQSLARLSPYFLKLFYLSTINASFANRLIYVDVDACPDYARPVVGPESDLDFYRYIRDKEVTTNNEDKVFNFIHLNGAHDISYRYDAKSDEIIGNGANNIIETTRANFEIINTYMEKMKEAGVYDNSVIIIVADHGLGAIATATLLIKPINSRGVMQENAEPQLTSKYFPASILEAAGIARTPDDFGISYFDIIGGMPPPTRYVQARRYLQVSQPIEAIQVPADASDLANWQRID